MKTQILTLITLIFFAPGSFASKCYSRKLGSQTLQLLWSDSGDHFSELRLSQPGRPPEINALGCGLSTPVTCQFEDQIGSAQFIWQDKTMWMVMNNGVARSLGLSVHPGPRTSIALQELPADVCKRIFPPDAGAITVFPSGNPDKWNMPDPDDATTR